MSHVSHRTENRIGGIRKMSLIVCNLYRVYKFAPLPVLVFSGKYRCNILYKNVNIPPK